LDEVSFSTNWSNPWIKFLGISGSRRPHSEKITPFGWFTRRTSCCFCEHVPGVNPIGFPSHVCLENNQVMVKGLSTYKYSSNVKNPLYLRTSSNKYLELFISEDTSFVSDYKTYDYQMLNSCHTLFLIACKTKCIILVYEKITHFLHHLIAYKSSAVNLKRKMCYVAIYVLWRCLYQIFWGEKVIFK